MSEQERVQNSVADERLFEGDPRESSLRYSLLDRPISELIQLDWESVAWIVLVIVAVVSRFYDLGTRAMSHDESLHTLYSFYLYNAGDYTHNPMMHGPLLFHINALVYALFGDSDATARFAPALAGVGVIWMARLFRIYIGRTGALIAGLLIAISPSLLFHSRYIRNDIYIALLTLIWVYGAFRYLDTRRFRWLIVLTTGMAVGFVTKENHFMNGAFIGAFFAALGLWKIVQQKIFGVVAPIFLLGAVGYWFHNHDQDVVAGALIAGSLVIAAILLLLAMRNHSWQALRSDAAMDLAVLMLTLVLPFTAPFGHLVMGWDAMAAATATDLARSAVLVGLMTVIATALAYYWFGMRPAATEESSETELTFGGWVQLMSFFWIVQVLFFTTFFTNLTGGLASGVVGSLGYWLAQQEVARGGQPDYYYLMLGALYEFLPMVLSGAGIGVVIYWLFKDSHWHAVSPDDLPSVDTTQSAGEDYLARLNANRTYFIVFVVWWIFAAWGAYTIAGEKMPWLMTHIVLPMCVLGGWYGGRLLRRIDWQRARTSNAVWLVGVTPALIFVVVQLLGGLPDLDRSVGAVSTFMQWVIALVIFAGLLYLTLRWSQAIGRLSALRLLAVGLVALLFLLTIRFSYMLTYINYDSATEYLVYAHASPDVKRALREIDLISERTVGERNIVVAYDDDSSWPLSWYMRLYPNSRFYGEAPNSDVMTAPVIIVGSDNYEKVHPYVVRDYVKRTYRLVWWPDQGYFNLTAQRFWETITDPQKMRDIAQIVFYRRYRDGATDSYRDLTQWPNRHEFEMWVRRDLAADIWDLGVAPVAASDTSLQAVARAAEIDLNAVALFNATYDNITLNAPRALDVNSDGHTVIADSDNHRIVVLDREGVELLSFGTFCNLGEREAGGCVDPDGSGPLELGDGQFNQPWGIAVADSGEIFVADTWNGRIQVFDAAGNFLRKWGAFNATNGELGDAYALYGPRGIDIDLDGNLVVADTGNKRIVRFSPDGGVVDQIGGGGVIGGRFEEPTDIAVDPNSGVIYVADAWNRRIQKLDAALNFLEEWPVPSWESQDRFHKPGLAVAANGDVYASDPAMFRIFVYKPDGTISASFGNFGDALDRFGLPVGVAADSAAGTILIADSDNNRVMVFPQAQ